MKPGRALAEDTALLCAGIGALAFLAVMVAVDVIRLLWSWLTGGRCW
jgi:hypothetical protein